MQMCSCVLEAHFLAFHDGLCCCAAFAPHASIVPRERLILSLPCDWRFLPKLGPYPHGDGPFFCSFIIQVCKEIFEPIAARSDANYSFVAGPRHFVATQHGAGPDLLPRFAGRYRPERPWDLITPGRLLGCRRPVPADAILL
jgi:hypothetical protein